MLNNKLYGIWTDAGTKISYVVMQLVNIIITCVWMRQLCNFGFACHTLQYLVDILIMLYCEVVVVKINP